MTIKTTTHQNLRPRVAFFVHIIPLLCRGHVSTMLRAAAKTVCLMLWSENLTLLFYNNEVLNDVDEESNSGSNVLSRIVLVVIHFEWSLSHASSNELSAVLFLSETVGHFTIIPLSGLNSINHNYNIT